MQLAPLDDGLHHGGDHIGGKRAWHIGEGPPDPPGEAPRHHGDRQAHGLEKPLGVDGGFAKGSHQRQQREESVAADVTAVRSSAQSGVALLSNEGTFLALSAVACQSLSSA